MAGDASQRAEGGRTDGDHHTRLHHIDRCREMAQAIGEFSGPWRAIPPSRIQWHTQDRVRHKHLVPGQARFREQAFEAPPCFIAIERDAGAASP